MFDANGLEGGVGQANGSQDQQSHQLLPSQPIHGGDVPSFINHANGSAPNNNASSANRMQVLNHRLKNRGGKFRRSHYRASFAGSLVHNGFRFEEKAIL